ncbi:MAG: dTDP-4-dehydrorhamnose 3,5-epimerase [Rickettsiaceae bacterium]|nr:dTDP-4-dehydrorhamnose 3,5-epimerase [Rickettsiaceae bacterium]
MEKINTVIDGLFVIKLSIFRDNRGFFVEKFNKRKFDELHEEEVGTIEFVQDNFSRSSINVMRGLHAQEGQGKLVGVASGAIFDVAVDIRENSKTFGKFFGVELSAENGLLLWIPDGFLHGFQVISDSADVHYKVTSYYDPSKELGINPLDPFFNISWPNKELAILSQKDKISPYYSEK